ncbi:FKBP-type peptidyl-prolyl cis-trans isomerase [Zobellia sp.]|nr:FKBP-type peptidyl-prolyl cis-trans isomerase [Zobellia sp.]
MKKFLFVLALTVFASCGDDDKEAENAETIDYIALNETQIKEYVEANELNAIRSDSGLYYVIEEEGDGERPNATSDVTVAYKGYYLDGAVFDESRDEGITFNLQQVIAGWTEGITYFKEGGNGILLVPAALGYGNFDNRGIPGGSVLIFEVNLIEVN